MKDKNVGAESISAQKENMESISQINVSLNRVDMESTPTMEIMK